MPKPLTDKEIQKLAKTPGFYAVGNAPGLYLRVRGKSVAWILRVMHNGHRRDLALGSYPALDLATARRNAVNASAEIKNGLPPRDSEAADRPNGTHAQPTFADATKTYLAQIKGTLRNQKHEAQWGSTLTAYAVPHLGNLPVLDISRHQVAEVFNAQVKARDGTFKPFWLAKRETASRVRGRIEHVLAHAARHLERYANPAELKTLKPLLPRRGKRKVKHHTALLYRHVPDFMRQLAEIDAQSARALTFVILTTTRSADVRGALWPEFDIEHAVWTIPPERHKTGDDTGHEHVVPLSRQALSLLAGQHKLDRTNLVFPNSHLNPLSDMALLEIIRGLKVPATVHGFRSSFRDWAAEQAKARWETAELCLAHEVGDDTERAYFRTSLIDERRLLMQAWADFILPETD